MLDVLCSELTLHVLLGLLQRGASAVSHDRYVYRPASASPTACTLRGYAVGDADIEPV